MQSNDGESAEDILNSLLSLQPTVDQPTGTGRGPTISLVGLSLATLNQLLSGRHITVQRGTTRAYLDEDEDEEFYDYEEEDEDSYALHFQRHVHQWFPPVTEPVGAGVKLLAGGDFGLVGPKVRSRRNRKNIARTILNRGSVAVPIHSKEDISTDLVPNTSGTSVAIYDHNIYTAQFSYNSSFFYTCSQDFRLHIYDMQAQRNSLNAPSRRTISASTDPSLWTSLSVRKVIHGHPGRWTITDANLSPDNERMIYSSITPTAYMTSTSPDGSDTQIPISFAQPPRIRRDRPFYDTSEDFGIWSCRFSADGNEVVAGGSGKIFVYDLIANRRTVKIAAHTDDVNSCCWADTASGNVLISASDDTFIKVWDRRSLGASPKPSGVLIGHTEGLTYVSAKGDGRYVISNGKDQAMRLWDLRQMRSSADFQDVQEKRYGVNNFDYRYPHYPKPRYAAHPKDCSVMTYRGHAVLRTLIRCYFSPAETTGSQYLYSGSADGKIRIWSLDGRIVQVLDRGKTLSGSLHDPSGPDTMSAPGVHTSTCVRDVSWHSQEPVMMSAGWENGQGGSVIAQHEWKGLSKMRGSLEDWEERHRLEELERQSERRRSQRLREQDRDRLNLNIPGAILADDE